MNALSAIAGWSHRKRRRVEAGNRVIDSDSDGIDHSSDERVTINIGNGAQLASSQDDKEWALDIDTETEERAAEKQRNRSRRKSSRKASQPSPNVPEVIEVADVLKPPESVQHEKIEERVVEQDEKQQNSQEQQRQQSSEALGLAAAAASYPSPPPTPGIDEQAPPSLQDDEKITDTQACNGVYMPDPQALSAEMTASSCRERSARYLARCFPVRYLVKVYFLLRRFLGLFGIRVSYPSSSSPLASHPIPDATSSSSSRSTSTQSPLLEPPVPIQAIRTDVSTSSSVQSQPHSSRPPPFRSKWSLPRLPGRSSRRSSTSSFIHSLRDSTQTNTTGEDDYSSDSSVASSVAMANLQQQKQKPQLHSPSVSIPASQPTLNQSHRKTTSVHKVSLAQLALNKPKLLVLDLDETLIHSTSRMGVSTAIGGSGTGRAGESGWSNSNGLKVRVVEVVLDGRSVVYHVYKRPWVDFFLRKVSTWYQLVIFTASMREYADPVIDWLDGGRGIFHQRLFRESCTYINGSYVKDLSIVDPDLARVCLVDNSPISYAKDQANGVPIEGWISDPSDEALLDLLPMLDSLRFTSDVRHILGLRLATTSAFAPGRPSRLRKSTNSISLSGTSTPGTTSIGSSSGNARGTESEKRKVAAVPASVSASMSASASAAR